MSPHHELIAGVYYPLKLAKIVGASMRFISNDSLRVLLYHDVAPHEEERFATQIRRLARSWNFVTPSEFAAMISGENPIKGRNLLLTFDDGFASNRMVAEKVLNPIGIKALFFVVSNFAAISDFNQAQQFIADHILLSSRTDMLPSHLYNMNWNDLEALLEQGHSIGAHTANHARLSKMNTRLELEKEIVHSADLLAERLGTSIEHFAYTFGDIKSFSPMSLTIAKERFRFVYSGLRGNNIKTVSPFALRRDAAHPANSVLLLDSFLEGTADIFYAPSRHKLDRWCLSDDSLLSNNS